MTINKLILILLSLFCCSRVQAQEWRLPNGGSIQIGNLNFTVHALSYRTGKLGSIEVGDIDNDGDEDFFYSSYFHVPMLVENKMGKFKEDGMSDWEFYQSHREIGTNRASHITLSDIDNDGDLDLISSANQLQVYYNENKGESWKKTELNFSGLYVATADFDNDGFEDIVSANHNYGIGWIKNSEDGFSNSVNFIDSLPGEAISTGDVDLDGDIDFVASSFNEIAVFINSNNGKFTKTTIDTGSYNVPEIVFTDLNSDGYPDILGRTFNLKDYQKNDVIVYINDVDSLSFSRLNIVTDSIYTAGRFVFPTDLNMDNKIDILTGNGSELEFIENLGDDNFILHESVFIGFELHNAAVIDYDNDGDLDIITGTNNCCNDWNYTYLLENDLISVSNETNSNVVTHHQLSQNYPNPFNPSTTIEYSIKEASNIDISVFNLLGEKVATLVDERKAAGTHSINFDASFLSSGIYYYRLKSEDFAITKKFTLIK